MEQQTNNYMKLAFRNWSEDIEILEADLEIISSTITESYLLRRLPDSTLLSQRNKHSSNHNPQTNKEVKAETPYAGPQT